MLHTCARYLVSFAVQDRTLKRWRAEGNHSRTIAKPDHAARKSKPDPYCGRSKCSTTLPKQPAYPRPPSQLAATCMNPRTIEKPMGVPVTANHQAIEPKQPAYPWPPNQMAASCINQPTIEKLVSVPVTANHPAIEPKVGKVFRVDGHVLSDQVQTFESISFSVSLVHHDAPARPPDVQASPPFSQPASQETYQQQLDKDDAPHNFPSQKTTSVADHACGMQPKLASAAVSDSQSGASVANKGANTAKWRQCECCENLADPAAYKKNRCKGSSSCR